MLHNARRSSLAVVLGVMVVLLTSVPGRSGAVNRDIVLYASDAATISGNWRKASSTTGADGLKMTSEDRGWASTAIPLADPTDYFEVEFDAEADVAYRVWLRLRAAADSKWNDSVWLQFSGAVAEDGSPLWRIGTDAARLVNLENCNGCGVSGWGWQDAAWWLGQPETFRFAQPGRQRLRVQTREDGVDVDQVVISASTHLSSPPGARTGDATIILRADSSGLLRQPYLQQVTDTSAVIVWTTREPAGGEVRYSDPDGVAATRLPESRLFLASDTGMSFDYYQHEVRLTGLIPTTQYRYSLVRSGVTLTAGDALRTAPPTGTGAVSFIAFGDSGVGSAAQRELAGRMSADAFDLSLHMGDLVYGSSTMHGGGSYPQYDPWFFDIYAPWLRSRPFFPSIGNHDDEVDQARPYREMLVLPENGADGAYPDHAERFYSFDYGRVHFVALDTETAFRDPSRRQSQLDWLERDLASTTQPWRVAYMHRPPYSAGTHHGSDLEVRRVFSPVFEKYGVQLVLAAHEHQYERTIPLQEHTVSGAPVTYVVSGGGGANLYPAGAARWTAASASAHHYIRGNAGECSLVLEAVGLEGLVFDRASIDRCASAPSPAADIVLYASDVTTIAGNWARLPSWSGAGNVKMASAEGGWSATEAPKATPDDYFEASFDAPAGAYRVWLRLRGAGDSKYNDSVWVQFSDAADAQGAPLWRIGTTQGLLVNLEGCGGCGMEQWGWQNTAWWLGESSVVRFGTRGRHTIRVQTREDGVEVDQIVLSPQRYFSSSPGDVRRDETIVSK